MIGLISRPNNDLWWHGSYFGIWDALSSKKLAKIDLENCSKKARVAKISLIHYELISFFFSLKFAVRELFWYRANSKHVSFTMTSHNTVKYCQNTAKLHNLSNNWIFSWYFPVNLAHLMCIGIFISLDQVTWEPARKMI